MMGDGPAKRLSAYPKVMDRLIAEFAGLPGIGRRSAERLAFHLLKSDEGEALALAQAIIDLKKQVRHCGTCFHLCEQTCPICDDATRRRDQVLVVEQPKDLLAIEQVGMYRGLYHVLMGRLSPLDDIGPGELTIGPLLSRLDRPEINPGGVRIAEVILGLNPNLEGDGTALYLAEQIKTRGVKLTRLARGLPAGSSLEYASAAVLADALEGRQGVE